MSPSDFTSDERQAICDEIARRISELEASGAVACMQIRQEICRQVCSAAIRVKQNRSGNAGVGDPSLDIQSAVEQARQTVTPWLWVISLLGFGMAILNTSRIAKIYGGWRAGRRALKVGSQPI